MKLLSANRSQGFTLIEIISTLVIVSVIMTMTAFMVTPILHQQTMARETAALSQRVQSVIWRIGRDVATMTNVVSSSATSMEYETFDSDGNIHHRTLAWAGVNQPITIDGHALIPNVREFKLGYLDRPDGTPVSTWTPQTRMVEFTVDMGRHGSRFKTRMFARNL